MSFSRLIHKTPLANEKNNAYNITEFSCNFLQKILQSRFIGEGVYGLEKYWAPVLDYMDEYMIAPPFDIKEEKFTSGTTFEHEDINNIALFQLSLEEPMFMPLNTKYFINLFKSVENFSYTDIFTQILFCKRQDNWRELAITQYESYLKGIDRPLEGKFSIKLQEKILSALYQMNRYQVNRSQVIEMEEKILQSNFRFECRFLVYEDKYAGEFTSYLKKLLVNLQHFNKFEIKKIGNKQKQNFLILMENRQFQTEFVNQLLSEKEMYSFLCNSNPFDVQKEEFEKPINPGSVPNNLEVDKVLQEASHIMPKSLNKRMATNESQIRAINQALMRVGIVSQPLQVTEIYQGASLLKVQMKIPPEITYTAITKRLVDIQAAMGNTNITVEIGDKPDTINIFIPLDKRESLYFNSLLKSVEFQKFKNENILPFIIGENLNGDYIFACLTKLRHLLVAGTTGSGKSVFLNLIILCLILSVPPEQLVLYLIDPKMVEFYQFKEFPQVKDVIVDMRKANGILISLVEEMDKRYETFCKSGCRDIQSYNRKNETKLPYIVCVIDELADLMMVNKSVEDQIVRLGQKARGAGIHLIIATQRPSVDVVTGLIKANMPSRIAFTVTSSTDSKTIIDKGGAEKLMGKGDGLAKIEGNKVELERFQAPVLSLDPDEEERIYEKLIGLFDGVAIGGKLEEVNEVNILDQLKTCIANSGELQIDRLGRLMGIGNNRLTALMRELLDENWLRKEGRSYVINVDEAELYKWRNNSNQNNLLEGQWL
jgi:DNA segregation ATPase FtsK/SpoIIIE, S-DNA-T family